MADMDPDTIRRISKTVSDLYGDATVRMLEATKKRMARGIDEPGWAERKLLDVVGLRDDAMEQIRRLERDGPIAVRKAIEQAYNTGAVGASDTMAEIAGRVFQPRTNTQAVEALARETITGLRSSHMGILRSTDDIYRRIIAETSTAGMVTGTDNQVEAIQRALNRFADAGVTGYVDKAGRRWEIETYAEMATRTGASRSMIQGRVDGYVDAGRNFLIVSNHAQECEMCRPFEGRGISIDGSGVGTEQGGIRIVASLASAQRAGLFHPNCRHDSRPIIPGLTEPWDSPTEDPVGEIERRQQRQMENNVRKWRKREAVALTPEAQAVANAKVRYWDGALKAHVKRYDLQPKRHRTLPQFGARPVGRARRAVTPPSAPTTMARQVKKASESFATMPGPRSTVGRATREALESIERVHDIPNGMPAIRVTNRHTKNSLGHFKWTQSGRAVEINVRTTGSGHASTFAHEFGHFLDHQGFGSAGGFMSDKPSPAMKRVLDAINNSRSTQLLRDAAKIDRRTANYVKYATAPAEMWARAYAQWVATTSNNTSMLQELMRWRTLKGADRFSQWDSNEFEPIRAAIDALMREEGLMK